MAYDTWENCGYKVIDTLNRFDTTLANIEESLKRTEARQAVSETKNWVTSVGSAMFVVLSAKFLGV